MAVRNQHPCVHHGVLNSTTCISNPCCIKHMHSHLVHGRSCMECTSRAVQIPTEWVVNSSGRRAKQRNESKTKQKTAKKQLGIYYCTCTRHVVHKHVLPCATMDEHQTLIKLLDRLTAPRQPSLDVIARQHVKNICKDSPELIPFAADYLLERLKAPHAQTRLLALEVINDLFTRSKVLAWICGYTHSICWCLCTLGVQTLS